MATAYKRTKRSTGPKSWLNITTKINGTVSTSSSTRVAGRTTTITPKGVRKTVNNNGWVTRKFTPTFTKPKRKSTTSKAARRKNEALWSNTFYSKDKKDSSAEFNSDDFVKTLENIDTKLESLDMNKWSAKQTKWFFIIVIAACVLIQAWLR